MERPLDGRLLAIAALIPPGTRVADVGSGHGLLPRHLLASGRASWCVATERNARRLASVPRFADETRLSLRDGDGLAPLLREDRIDVVVLAGLGGPSIVRILDSPRRGLLGARRFVLQPQTGAAGLRRWLAGSGFTLADERLVASAGRYYTVLAAEPGVWPCHDEDLFEAGPLLVARRDPLLRPAWEEEEARLVSILGSARPGRGRRAAEARLALARRVLAAL